MRKFSPNIPILVIYHGNCADGFTGAWVAWQYFNRQVPALNVEYHAGVYQKDPPDCAGKDVVIIDFSYKRSAMELIHQECHSLTILDHHKSAIDDLTPWVEEYAQYCKSAGYVNEELEVVFDLDRSGAMIAWDYFEPDLPPPKLLEHVQDRDLWRFKLRGTREIQACLFSYPYEFSIWNRLMLGTSTNSLINDGNAIERKHFKDIHELLAVMQHTAEIGGIKNVPVCNLPYTLTSDAGHIMAKASETGMAACYYDKPEGREFGLRSVDGGPDVSEIAKRYGGGGHKNSAGFRIPHGRCVRIAGHPHMIVLEGNGNNGGL